jgi:ABC-type protease/lipase transport system fused ATPase/permease subunit
MEQCINIIIVVRAFLTAPSLVVVLVLALLYLLGVFQFQGYKTIFCQIVVLRLIVVVVVVVSSSGSSSSSSSSGSSSTRDTENARTLLDHTLSTEAEYSAILWCSRGADDTKEPTPQQQQHRRLL